jgi:hypothetical protein
MRSSVTILHQWVVPDEPMRLTTGAKEETITVAARLRRPHIE